MTIEDQARAVETKITEIRHHCHRIARLCMMILRIETVGSDVFELTQEQKQALLGYYQTRKAELQSLVEELP